MEKPVKSDRISNLPWDVLNSILVHLPLRDVARTSLLSRKWRYKWTSLSQFVIDDKCFPYSLPDKTRWGEIRRIFHLVQSNHNGPIEKFKLAAYCYPDHSDLNEWINYLTVKGIKELILQDFSFIRRFKLPSCLFSCPRLICLELHGCILKLPPTFRGFNCLKSLQLAQVSIISETLEYLITSCPALERLTLLNIDHLAILRIRNQNLKYLKIDSEFEDIFLQSSPLLASVDIRMIPVDGRSMPWSEERDPSNLIRVLGCLYGIKKLTLSSYFIKVGHSNEVIRPVVDFLKDQCLYNFFFSQLKVVRIRGLCGTRPELEFLKLILAHSPVLEALTVVKYGSERVPESLLLHVERASEKLKITSLSL
ncbi:PREDICTED: F-box/FBD/LRR-repeat protein At1g13570 isoform X2 [Theobroma cacao]|uniref:F-box/FBD/LRR-repeat protein At1g13570 isoform X2 n=1 Tax=Theobroma cacao TaxID=3641 RepID=A0AB32W8R7_THECC|nr:PREDICTED: F-box/FBD/LRR-repeat protein At1g13570 isoform X2 [Theobroma cacao]